MVGDAERSPPILQRWLSYYSSIPNQRTSIWREGISVSLPHLSYFRSAAEAETGQSLLFGSLASACTLVRAPLWWQVKYGNMLSSALLFVSRPWHHSPHRADPAKGCLHSLASRRGYNSAALPNLSLVPDQCCCLTRGSSYMCDQSYVPLPHKRV